MILETKEEKDAFEFVCNLASRLTDREGCNDLTSEEMKKFGHLMVKSANEDGTSFLRKIIMDFDVIYWLQKQVKS